MATCSWRKKDLNLLSLRRLADVGVARATSGVARIGFHKKATQQRKATLVQKHLVVRVVECTLDFSLRCDEPPFSQRVLDRTASRNLSNPG